jgi:methylmalonyl-CoA mutase
MSDLATWRDMALAVLRKSGRAGPESTADDVERLLTTTTDDGVAIAPLYLSGPPAPALAPRERPGWDVRTRHDATDPGLAGAIAEDVAGGATSIWLTVDDPATLEQLPELDIPIHLDAGEHTLAAATHLRDWTGNLGNDPLRSAHPGRWNSLSRYASGRLRLATVDAVGYHEAGAGDAEELACALATGVAYLRELDEAGLPAFEQIDFRYAVGADQFVSSAKLRAARLLWARVAEVCGAEGARQRQHAVTSTAMTTTRAPWNNIVRATVAAFAAVTGGVDALTVLPHEPGPDARRLARNTQAMLAVEAHAARVHDPLAGSWYAENLTRDLAAAAWDWFRKIEDNGGMAASLADGMIGDRIAATRERRLADLRHGRRTLVGTTHYAQPDEGHSEHRGGQYAAEFRRLRARVPGGGRPVPLVLLGSRADASFAEQFLAIGGLRATRDAEGPVVCVCGADAEAGDALAFLRSSGARRIWAAGEPVPGLDVDGWLTPGGDAVATLDALLDDLGAPR